jgi:hypothetical protein
MPQTHRREAYAVFVSDGTILIKTYLSGRGLGRLGIRKSSGITGHIGSIRRKRGDTLVGTLGDEYGEDFAEGYRSDMRLDTLLEREGAGSLSELLRKRR